jgi:hypothetical protein
MAIPTTTVHPQTMIDSIRGMSVQWRRKSVLDNPLQTPRGISLLILRGTPLRMPNGTLPQVLRETPSKTLRRTRGGMVHHNPSAGEIHLPVGIGLLKVCRPPVRVEALRGRGLLTAAGQVRTSKEDILVEVPEIAGVQTRRDQTGSQGVAGAEMYVIVLRSARRGPQPLGQLQGGVTLQGMETGHQPEMAQAC